MKLNTGEEDFVIVTYRPLSQVRLKFVFVLMEIIFKIDISGIIGLKKNIQEFLPESAVFYWDSMEVLPIKEVENGICEEVEEGNGDFWSVYLH